MIEGEIIDIRVFAEKETDRLVLRELTLADAPALFQHYSDAEVAQFNDVERMTNIREAEELIQSFHAAYDRGLGMHWGIFSKNNWQLIGTCGFLRWEIFKAQKAVIGYDLNPAFGGQGLVGESLKWVIHYGFEELNLNRIEAFVVSDNFRTQNVFMDLGFQKEGVLRENNFIKGQFIDEISFSLLKRDWLMG